jgi:hypothetical protein
MEAAGYREDKLKTKQDEIEGLTLQASDITLQRFLASCARFLAEIRMMVTPN